MLSPDTHASKCSVIADAKIFSGFFTAVVDVLSPGFVRKDSNEMDCTVVDWWLKDLDDTNSETLFFVLQDIVEYGLFARGIVVGSYLG